MSDILYNPFNDNPVIMCIGVQVSPHKKEELIIHQRDDIQKQITAFCKAHNLNQSASIDILNKKKVLLFQYNPSIIVRVSKLEENEFNETNENDECEEQVNLEEKIIEKVSSGNQSFKELRNDKPIFKSVEMQKMHNRKAITKENILKMKLMKYKEIFKSLDSDNDGFISSKNICLSALGQELLEALTPVLEILQKSKKPMGLKEFCIKADRCLTLKISPND